MASEEIAVGAGDLIDGWTVVEIATDYWRRGETCVFLVPKDEEPPTGREWAPVHRPTDEEGRPLLCPNCYGPDREGYPIEVLEG